MVAFVRHDAVTFIASPAGAVRRQVSPAYVAFVLSAGQTEPTLVRLGRAAAVDAAVNRWRKAVLTSITPTGTVVPGTEASVRAAGARLRAVAWDPLRAAIGDAKQVYVVPDGALNLVPFDALPFGRAGYLVDGAAKIHYVSTERDLVEFASPSPSRGRGLLAVGGPAYGLTPPAPGGSAPEMTASATTDVTPMRGRRAICGTFDTMAFPPLPASRREAEDVGALWRSVAGAGPHEREAIVLTGARANEAAFKKSGPGHLVLHLATHGFFLGGDCTAPGGTRAVGITKAPAPPAARPRSTPPENPLLLSGVALAGANRRSLAGPDDEDGILTAEEVAALDLDGVEWAVLSACESGLGQIRGGEGVMGLRRAFRVAGARTVIMSLWPVDDEATRTWMRALYEARLQERRSTADAMRAASLATLGDRRAKGLSTHPFYWAGFVAAGDWH
jgi:CHAT domain-containing protein